jgi:Protein of unknown function (DUF3775)
MNLSEAVKRVIDLARKVRDYYSTELPKRHPSYPLVGADEEPPPPPPEETELREFLTRLPEDMVSQLLLIMYLGRGDFGTDHLNEYYETLQHWKNGSRPADAVSQFMDKAPLADYLSDGLDELRKHRISPDRLPLKKVKVRKS